MPASGCSCNARRCGDIPIPPASTAGRWARSWKRASTRRLSEESFARHVTHWEKSADAEALDTAARYAAWATLTPAGRAAHAGGTLFRVPHKIDPMHLVPVETIEREGVTMLRLPETAWRHRDGFGLTDAGMGPQQALDQMNYCIWCHTQEKDFVQQGPEGA